jgi:outer membrane protein assembly factor BamB
MLSAVTATLSGFIFAGDLTGAFDAFDAKDGKVLYSFNVGGRLQSLR